MRKIKLSMLKIYISFLLTPSLSSSRLYKPLLNQSHRERKNWVRSFHLMAEEKSFKYVILGACPSAVSLSSSLNIRAFLDRSLNFSFFSCFLFSLITTHCFYSHSEIYACLAFDLVEVEYICVVSLHLFSYFFSDFKW